MLGCRFRPSVKAGSEAALGDVMSKPTILTVDDDPMVSAAITRDLSSRYGADYRIVRATSGAQALAVLTELALRDEPVALIAADQRMPQMTGVEMLEQARVHAPEAKFLLLTAYADTDVAIKAINDIGLDYYLLKPWDPPEERLYPIIDDPLGDWRQANRDHTSDVRVVGHRWSDRSHESRCFWRATMCPTAGTTSSATARPSGCATSPKRHRPTSRSCSCRTATRSARRRPSIWQARSVCAPPRNSPCTTCASSAAGRPAWPPRCTRRPRA